MNKTMTVNSQTMQAILSRLDQLTTDVKVIKEKLFHQEPEYGSTEWWEWSDKKGLEDIEKGDVYELRDKRELDQFFNNIRKGASNEKYHRKVRH